MNTSKQHALSYSQIPNPSPQKWDTLAYNHSGANRNPTRSTFSQVYTTQIHKTHGEKMVETFQASERLLSPRRANCLYPYLRPSAPPHLSSPGIPRGLQAHASYSLLEGLCSVDAPGASSRDARGPAVYNLARSHKETDTLCVSGTMLNIAAQIARIDPIGSPLKPSSSHVAVMMSLCGETNSVVRPCGKHAATFINA